MRSFFFIPISAVFVLLFIHPATVPATDLENIMKTNDFIGTEPENIRWSYDSRFIYFDWKNPADKTQGTFCYDTQKKKLALLNADESKQIPPASTVWNKAKTRGLVISGSSLHLYDRDKGRLQPLVEFGERLRAAAWGKKEEKVFFLSENGIYSFGLSAPHLKELIHFQAEIEKKPQEEPGPGEKHIAQEEMKLIKNHPVSGFSFRRDSDFPFLPKNALVLKKGERPADFQVFNDDKWLIVGIFSYQEGGGRSTLIPRFVSTSGYTETENSRTKASGSMAFRPRFLLCSPAEGKQVELKSKKSKSYISKVLISPLGKIIGLNKSEDFHDAWLLQFNAKGEEEKEITHLHEDAWLEEEIGRNLRFIPEQEKIVTILETDDHLRLVEIDMSGKVEILTPGNYEVKEFRLTEDGKKVVFTSSEGHPGITNTYLLELTTHKKMALTTGNAFQQAFPSPDLNKLAVVKSDAVTPPELYLLKNRHEIRITRSPAPEFLMLALKNPEIISFKASDGVPVYARLLRPAKKNGAAVLFVHGAGYLQDAHFGWSDSYWREFLFGNLLSEKGYTFMDIDYRGSAGYGRNFRTGIFGHMGGRDLDDLIDGVKYLIDNEGILPKRIGLFGGSYGGFLTLMGLCKYPDTFACGAALRPVTDWAHYSAFYAQPILGGTPQDVPENYRRSSPIYFAESLKKPLLILHGMIDDNVHFQDSVRLAERLIELKKSDWWLAGYPVERHTFRFSESWLDEFRRILELFETYLNPKK